MRAGSIRSSGPWVFGRLGRSFKASRFWVRFIILMEFYSSSLIQWNLVAATWYVSITVKDARNRLITVLFNIACNVLKLIASKVENFNTSLNYMFTLTQCSKTQTCAPRRSNLMEPNILRLKREHNMFFKASSWNIRFNLS